MDPVEVDGEDVGRLMVRVVDLQNVVMKDEREVEMVLEVGDEIVVEEIVVEMIVGSAGIVDSVETGAASVGSFDSDFVEMIGSDFEIEIVDSVFAVEIVVRVVSTAASEFEVGKIGFERSFVETAVVEVEPDG